MKNSNRRKNNVRLERGAPRHWSSRGLIQEMHSEKSVGRAHAYLIAHGSAQTPCSNILGIHVVARVRIAARDTKHQRSVANFTRHKYLYTRDVIYRSLVTIKELSRNVELNEHDTRPDNKGNNVQFPNLFFFFFFYYSLLRNYVALKHFCSFSVLKTIIIVELVKITREGIVIKRKRLVSKMETDKDRVFVDSV